MKQIALFFAIQVLRKKYVVHIFWKYLKVKETMNEILNGQKGLRERVLKNTSVCEIHYSKDNL